MKRCKFCAEDIYDDETTICPHCGSNIEPIFCKALRIAKRGLPAFRKIALALLCLALLCIAAFATIHYGSPIYSEYKFKLELKQEIAALNEDVAKAAITCQQALPDNELKLSVIDKAISKLEAAIPPEDKGLTAAVGQANENLKEIKRKYVFVQYEGGLKLLAGNDKASAAKLLENAAEQGCVAAEFEIGKCYVGGIGIEKDLLKGFTWLAKYARHGSSNARIQAELANLFHSLSTDMQDKKVKQDCLDLAFACCEKAAEQGLPQAQCLFGVLYANGEGIPQDYDKALAWYRKAAMLNNADAQFHLGDCYLFGRGVNANNRTAAEWYRRSASSGHEKAEQALRKLLGSKSQDTVSENVRQSDSANDSVNTAGERNGENGSSAITSETIGLRNEYISKIKAFMHSYPVIEFSSDYCNDIEMIDNTYKKYAKKNTTSDIEFKVTHSINVKLFLSMLEAKACLHYIQEKFPLDRDFRDHERNAKQNYDDARTIFDRSAIFK